MTEKDIINQALDILFLVGKRERREDIIYRRPSIWIEYEESDDEYHIGILSIKIFHKPSKDYIEVFKVRISGWKYQLEPELLFVFINRGYVWTPLLDNIKNSSEYLNAKTEHFSILADY